MLNSPPCLPAENSSFSKESTAPESAPSSRCWPRFYAARHPHSEVSFPHYEGFFGKLVARFLNGEFGALEAVDPHFSALLYAGDRLESKPVIETALLVRQDRARRSLRRLQSRASGPRVPPKSATNSLPG